jgi:hypothetical protein
MKNVKFLIFAFSLLFFLKVKKIYCDFIENQISERDRDLHTILTENFVYSDCEENESVESCVSKPTCCHVTNSKGTFRYSACLDAMSKDNFRIFCRKFYEYSGSNGFFASECECNNFKDSFSLMYSINFRNIIFLIGFFILSII